PTFQQPTYETVPHSAHPIPANMYYLQTQTPIMIHSSQSPATYSVTPQGVVVLKTKESVMMVCPYEGINVITTVEREP
ncbi:hypothetical protein HDV05_001161, partial [Chytridiales sp. JEL 0842]